MENFFIVYDVISHTRQIINYMRWGDELLCPFNNENAFNNKKENHRRGAYGPAYIRSIFLYTVEGEID